jgi:hypothetical protein
MANIIAFLFWRISLYGFGLFNYFMYHGLSIRSGSFFRKSTEQEKNEFLLGEARVPSISDQGPANQP